MVEKFLGMMVGILLVLAVIIGIIGFLYNLISKKRKWNWKASFLAPWYYAEHGRWGLGLLFAFLFGSLIPFLMLGTSIYAGIRADNDLPAQKAEKSVQYMFGVTVLMLFTIYSQMRNIL